MYKLSRNTLILYYSLPKLLDETYKRSSLIGARFNAETKNYLMDSLHVSPDNRETFDSFAREVYSEVIEQMSSHIKRAKEKHDGGDWVRTPNGLHLTHRDHSGDSDTILGTTQRFMFITDDRNRLLYYEPNIRLNGQEDVVFDEANKRYYLALEDVVLHNTLEMEMSPSLMRIPFYDCIIFRFDIDRHFEPGIVEALDVAVEGSFSYGVLYRYLLLDGLTRDAQDVVLPLYQKNMQDILNRLLTIRYPYKR